MLRRALLLTLVALSACAALNDDAIGWEATPSHKPLSPVFRELSRADLYSKCGTNIACCHRDYTTGLAWIYTEPNPPQWLVDHELKHAAGYDHAPWKHTPYVAFRR